MRSLKLELIILECVNRALDGKEDRLGDYIDPTVEQIKQLMLELIGDPDKQDLWAQDCEAYAKKLRQKVEEL